MQQAHPSSPFNPAAVQGSPLPFHPVDKLAVQAPEKPPMFLKEQFKEQPLPWTTSLSRRLKSLPLHVLDGHSTTSQFKGCPPSIQKTKGKLFSFAKLKTSMADEELVADESLPSPALFKRAYPLTSHGTRRPASIQDLTSLTIYSWRSPPLPSSATTSKSRPALGEQVASPIFSDA